MEFLELSKYQNLELIAKSAVEGFITGQHRSPFTGFSVEFSEHKSYNFGDSTKNIDWKVFARTDKLYVRNYEAETNLRAQVIVDVSSSMYVEGGGIRKLDFAVLAAAALGYVFQKQRDAFGLCVYSSEFQFLTPLKSTASHLRNYFSELMKLRAFEVKKDKRQSSNLIETIKAVNTTLHKRSLIVLFTDFFEDGNDLDALFQEMQSLKFQKHEVVAFHLVDDLLDLNLNLENKEYVFVDSETDKEIQLNPTQYKEVYKAKMDAFTKRVNLKCGELKIDHVLVNTKQGLDQVLAAYLNKRSKMNV